MLGLWLLLKCGSQECHKCAPGSGKTVVVGAKDRATNRVVAEPVAHTDKAECDRFPTMSRNVERRSPRIYPTHGEGSLSTTMDPPYLRAEPQNVQSRKIPVRCTSSSAQRCLATRESISDSSSREHTAGTVSMPPHIRPGVKVEAALLVYRLSA